MNTRFLAPLLVCLALLFAFASCGKKLSDHSTAGAPAHQSLLPLDAVSAEGCLNFPKLFAGLRNVEPQREAVVLPTSISFDSAAGVRENFRRLVAYGQIAVKREAMADAVDLPAARQEGCSKVVLTGSDGNETEFAVKSSAADNLSVEAESGEQFEFTWVSPESVKERHRYATLDQPCGTSDKSVFVNVTRVIDWNESGVATLVPATGTVFSVDQEFISLAAAAVGDSPDSVYVSNAGGLKSIDLDKLNALAAKPPSAEIVSCGGPGAGMASDLPHNPTNGPMHHSHPSPSPNNGGEGELPRR